MKYIGTIIAVLISFAAFNQFEYYYCDSYGIVFQSNVLGCCKEEKGTFPVFSDIASTPDGRLFGVDTLIRELNLSTQSIAQIITPIDINGNIIVGAAGMVALDDDFLIIDRLDSLFLVEINTGISQNIGFTGYYCAGDFVFINGYLYMASNFNDLIRIKLNPVSHLIEDVVNVGYIDLPESVFGLFKGYRNEKDNSIELFGFSGMKLFRINTQNAQVVFVCEVADNYVYGTTEKVLVGNNSLFSNDINIITPNNDGVNDFIQFEENSGVESLTVFNRWGEEVFYSDIIPIHWNGIDQSSRNLSDGVYFYIIKSKSCANVESRTLQGTVTILR